MCLQSLFFFFNDTATTEIYTLSLHDALPIYPGEYRVRQAECDVRRDSAGSPSRLLRRVHREAPERVRHGCWRRSEEHTSELQSRQYLVCRLLLEKKKNKIKKSRMIEIDVGRI